MRRSLISYILPIRAQNASRADELADYLRTLAVREIIVVDGSAPEVFAAHHALLAQFATHVRPDERIAGLNGKVRGVLTGLALAQCEHAIVADDDVRYDERSLQQVLRALERADVVRPQNYFAPLPWHAIVDTARTLINRALDGDWPGTLAFRRSALSGGYNADVLFENLELVRTVRARGGTECVARDIYVRRLPPGARHFWSQRIRQAYDEFARPARLAAALLVLPSVFAAFATGLWLYPAMVTAASIALAAFGWVRDGGTAYFPLLSVFAAPLWVLERSICAWLAVYERLRFGGVRYAGKTIAAAASSARELERRWAV